MCSVCTRPLKKRIWLTIGLLLTVGICEARTGSGDLSYAGSSLWTDVRDVAIRDDRAYCALANGPGGLRIVRNDPRGLLPVGQLSLDGPALGVAAGEDLALVAAGESGLQVIDVSYPSQPQGLASLPTSDEALAVAVSDSLAFVACGYGGVAVLSIVEPDKPQLVGRFETPDRTHGFQAADTLLYVAHGHDGLRVMSIGRPEMPHSLGLDLTPPIPGLPNCSARRPSPMSAGR